MNTADAEVDADAVEQIETLGSPVVAAPFGLELEVAQLAPEEREEFAREMGLGEPSRDRVMQAIFRLTDYITFYTCAEYEPYLAKRKAGANTQLVLVAGEDMVRA